MKHDYRILIGIACVGALLVGCDVSTTAPANPTPITAPTPQAQPAATNAPAPSYPGPGENNSYPAPTTSP